MRTTLTLDDDLAERLKQAAHRDGKPFKVILNNALRAGLGLHDKPAHKPGKIALRTFHSPLKTGIDETKLNQMADQLDAEDFLAETLRSSKKA